MWRWYKQCFCSGPRRGFLAPDWRKPLGGFATRWRGGWQAWSPNINGMGHGCTHPLEWRWQ